MIVRFTLTRLVTWWGLLALGLLATACAGREKCTLIASDFEQFQGWVDPPAFLSTEHAHSGRYAYHMDRQTEFGASFITPLSACPFVPRRLWLSGWVYYPTGSVSATLVVAINCHGRRPDVWEGFSLDQVVTRYGVWVPVRKYIRLPQDLLPSDEVKFYVWHGNPYTDSAFLDDLKLEGLK